VEGLRVLLEEADAEHSLRLRQAKTLQLGDGTAAAVNSMSIDNFMGMSDGTAAAAAAVTAGQSRGSLSSDLATPIRTNHLYNCLVPS
jgi:hypothetical protein